MKEWIKKMSVLQEKPKREESNMMKVFFIFLRIIFPGTVYLFRRRLVLSSDKASDKVKNARLYVEVHYCLTSLILKENANVFQVNQNGKNLWSKAKHKILG